MTPEKIAKLDEQFRHPASIAENPIAAYHAIRALLLYTAELEEKLRLSVMLREGARGKSVAELADILPPPPIFKPPEFIGAVDVGIDGARVTWDDDGTITRIERMGGDFG